LAPNKDFELLPYLNAIKSELAGFDFNVEIVEKIKKGDSAIESAFIKPGTKQHLLQIVVPEAITDIIGRNDLLRIKIEVDTDPPGGFETEVKTLLQPIPFSVRSYKQPDLFAGKIHALLHRDWQGLRIKGRDYYDFVWYVGRSTPIHLHHLEQRLRQSNAWKSEEHINIEVLLTLLENKFSQIDFELAKKDILPFIKDTGAVEIWSKDFFLSLLPRLEIC
jgi:hypothetical protein